MDNLPTRTNNPGDLKFIGQEGATKDSSGFASFQSPKEGYGALLNDVQTKINRSPNSTLADFANTYAPPTDGNNTAQYTANLANKLGVPPNSTLASLQPKIGQFAEAIGGNEGFKDINSNPNPTPQEITDNAPSDPSKMSTWQKIALGLGALGVGAGAVALAPETGGGSLAGLGEASALGEAALGSAVGAGEVTGSTAGGAGLLSKGLSMAKGLLPAGAVEGINLLSGSGNAKATQAGADEVANASAQAGQQEANATAKAEQDSIQEQEMLADEASAKKSIADATSAVSALNQSLQTTPTGKLLAQQTTTQPTLQYMAQNGYLPETSSGLNDFTGANKKVNDSVSELSQGVEHVLKEEGNKGQLSDAVREAYKNIDQYVPTHERASAKKYVDELAQTYNDTYGKGTGSVGLHHMEQGKREQYQAVAKWDVTRPSAKTAAHRSFAKGLRTTIEKNTKHKDLYNRIMKEEQKMFDAKKIMKKMNGKKALEHKGFFRGVLKSYGKYVGTYIGDKFGGPIGAIVGTMVGDHLTKAVDKRFGKTYFESKEGKKLIELASKKSPHMAKILKSELQKYGVKAEEFETKVEEKTGVKELLHEDIKENLVDSQGKHDLRTTMTNLEKGYSKKQIPKIMKGLYEKNQTGKFTPQEISKIASKYKSKKLPGFVKERVSPDNNK